MLITGADFSMTLESREHVLISVDAIPVASLSDDDAGVEHRNEV